MRGLMTAYLSTPLDEVLVVLGVHCDFHLHNVVLGVGRKEDGNGKIEGRRNGNRKWKRREWGLK